jgi:hypothetical protein
VRSLAVAPVVAPVAVLVILWSTFVAMSPTARAQSCDLYATDFGNFSGPPDLTDGEFRVRWCLNGATVTGSNFCPTGNALKLDASSEDPIILIATGAANCSAIEVSFKYAQFAASSTIVKYALTNATTVTCSASTTLTLGALTATGGDLLSNDSARNVGWRLPSIRSRCEHERHHDRRSRHSSRGMLYNWPRLLRNRLGGMRGPCDRSVCLCARSVLLRVGMGRAMRC